MLTKPSSKRGLKSAAALFLTMTCAACQTSGPPPRPTLPVPPPAFGKPIPAPRASAGDDARAYAARALGALSQANGRLKNDDAFYGDVRREFSN